MQTLVIFYHIEQLFFEKLFRNFLDFLGKFVGIFLEDYLGGIFWKNFLGGFFLGGFFGRIFWEELFGMNFCLNC